MALLFLSGNAKAQELDCVVELNKEQIPNVAFNYLTELKPALETYINEHQWTDDEFLEQERIDCRMQIIINQGSNDFRFQAEIIVSAQRPIYNTVQQTTSIIISDAFWTFSYTQGTNLIHDELQFNDLVSIIDYYCHLIIGLDYDTFAQNGGNASFTKAQNILDTAQSTGSMGWDRNSNNRRNRYFLITDLLNPSYDLFRQALYKYYRLGLDNFTNDPEAARQQIMEALTMIRDTRRRTTNPYLFDIFFDAKSKEIASIFEDADTRVRLEAYALLRNTDQSHLSDYEILQN